MRRNVKKNSTAGERSLAPCAGLELRPVTIVSSFEPHDAAQRAGLDKLPYSLKVAVVAAILIDGEQAIVLLRNLYQRNSLFQGCCERFIDNHVAACLKTPPRKRIMGLVWSGNNNKTNFRNREQFVNTPHDPNIRIFFRGFATAALQDGG